MRQTVIVGNWKMNGSKASIASLLSELKAGVTSLNQVKWAVIPPFVYLDQVSQSLAETDIAWGAQNLCIEAQGAYTGEVSGSMLKDIGCHYVLIGHSERRSLYGETDDIVAKKFIKAQENGLTPILCVGETLVEREQGLAQQVIERQVGAVLNLQPNAALLENALIAYEPVWAIGTGKTATPELAQEAHGWIRSQIASANQQVAARTAILYGGSMKPENARELLSMPDIDGGLIGGASLKAEEFLKIGQAAVG